MIKILIILFILYYIFFNQSPSKDTINENFSGYKICAPIATITLYTSSSCCYCKQMESEWNKFVKNIKSNCRYKHLIKVEHKIDDEIDDETITHVPTIKLKVSEDKINGIHEKVIEFKYDMTAGMFEKFVIENIVDYGELGGNYYVDCDKGKMYNKYYTLCDDEHRRWNTY